MAKTKTDDKLKKLPKRQRENVGKRKGEPVSVEEAVSVLKSFKGPKFDQTVEVCFNLGIDPRHADQAIRGSVSLPKGIGKTMRVVAFCTGDKSKACLEAGAVKAGAEDLVAEIERGWMEFDVAIASPDMMRVISKLGRVLGPKGLMPSPKAGTVTKDVVEAVREFAAGKVEYRNDKGGNVHAPVGKMSFPEADLVENLNHFIKVIERMRPSSVKGQFMKKVAISGTMTPSVLIHVASDVE